MYGRFQSRLERHFSLFASLVVLIVTGVWVTAQFVPDIADWIERRNVFVVVLIVLMVDALARLVDLKVATRPAIAVFANQHQASAAIAAHIKEHPPKSADFIAYSATTYIEVMRDLDALGCSVRILIKHPDSAIGEQVDRIRFGLSEIMKTVFVGGSVDVRGYREPASVRGCLLDEDLVSMGWYTYANAPLGVFGHGNSVIVARIKEGEPGQLLAGTFRQAFDDLWREATVLDKASISAPTVTPGG